MKLDMNPGGNAVPRWRRWAVKLAQHAAWVLPELPGARSPWAEAMRRELDYIEDDRAALRWALGCVVAGYKARLAARPGFTSPVIARDVLRHVAACGALMLVIGFAFLENAESQTEPPGPVIDETACDLPDTPSGPAGARASRPHLLRGRRDARAPVPDPAPETSCAGRNAPVLPKYQTR